MALILIVDDVPDIVNVTAAMLEALGHEVRKAYDGHEALSQIMHTAFDVYLVDIGLPDMSGLEVARFIRQMYGEKPKVLAVTGHIGRGMRVSCLNAGCNYYVSKPIHCRELNELIEHQTR